MSARKFNLDKNFSWSILESIIIQCRSAFHKYSTFSNFNRCSKMLHCKLLRHKYLIQIQNLSYLSIHEKEKKKENRKESGMGRRYLK